MHEAKWRAKEKGPGMLVARRGPQCGLEIDERTKLNAFLNLGQLSQGIHLPDFVAARFETHRMVPALLWRDFLRQFLVGTTQTRILRAIARW
jgi:hypothetical protein